MISDEFEWSTSKVMIEMFGGPNNCKGFQLGGSIISFCSRGTTTGIGNGAVLAISHLGKHCSKAKSTGIRLKDKFFGEVRSDEQIIFIHEEMLDEDERFFTFLGPIPCNMILQEL